MIKALRSIIHENATPKEANESFERFKREERK
jgi:hypothetical protein